jgi:preprotein translocase subunit SecE
MANQISEYIRTSILEMKKVTWPTKKETYNFTALVVVVSVATAAYLGVFDFIFQKAFEIFINRA